MSTVEQKAAERRQCWHKGCEYLLNDEARTAWIVKGPRIGRHRRYRIPDSVVISGKTYIVESVEMGAFKRAKCLRHLVVPDSIEYLDEYNFSSLPQLRSIYIGKGLKCLSSWIFHGNKKLRHFEIDKANTKICLEDGIIYMKSGKCAVTTPFSPKHLSIKEGVEEVDNVAFWYNKNLESVAFPSTLKKIGDNSFSGCPKLKEVRLPEGFEECVIQCFMDNPALELVDLPSTMKVLNDETFYNCPNLKALVIRTDSVLVPKGQMELPPCCTLRVPEDLIEEYKNHPLWSQAMRIEPIPNG